MRIQWRQTTSFSFMLQEARTKKAFSLMSPALIAMMESLLVKAPSSFREVVIDIIVLRIRYPKRVIFALGMVDFFTDEIQTYLVGNNEAIACTTTHYLLGTKIKERMDLFKKLKNAVEELAIEIPNHLEMFEFVLLKKEISGFEKSLTDKHAILKSLDEAFINLRSNDNVNQCKHFLRTAATDAAIVLENVNLPDNW